LNDARVVVDARATMERARASHDAIERIERAASKELRAQPRTHKERVTQHAVVAALVDASVTHAKRLVR